jgi:hypothetical protein
MEQKKAAAVGMSSADCTNEERMILFFSPKICDLFVPID